MDSNIHFSSDSEIRRAGASLSQELVSLRVDSGDDDEVLQQLTNHVVVDAVSGDPEYVIPLLVHALTHSSMLVSGALHLANRHEAVRMSQDEIWEIVRKAVWNHSFPSDEPQ